MPRFFNPRTTARPSSKFSHGVAHLGRARRLVISGQVGVLADGTVLPDLETQMEAAWDNLAAVLEEGGMTIADLINLRAYVTVPGSQELFRKIRDRRLGGHVPALTYLEVTGLVRPDFLFALEGEAVVEDMDAIADALPGAREFSAPAGAIRSKDNG